VFEECDKKGISRDELMTMLSYFDIKNFADRIECPMLMAFGLQDGTCPPHTNFAAYNLVPAPKE
jgi:cephalosporin-C deacetylase-like acetyl esterase